MSGRSTARALLGAGVFLITMVAATSTSASPLDLPDDGTGKRWHALTDTAGLGPADVAQVCPQDGQTRCAGSVGGRDLTGWVWATADQVVAFMGRYDPAILTAQPPSIGGAEHLFTAIGLAGDMGETFMVDGYNFHHSFSGGWTASSDETGQPIAGGAGYGWYPFNGSFFVGPVADPPSSWYGVWLWRPANDDITPPVITPSVSGTPGAGDWYVSDVAVTWDVGDAESPLLAQDGCDPATLATDTTGATFTCQATSAGGSTMRSVLVKRDMAAPQVTCVAPVQVFEIFQFGAWVRANVTDATSGPANPIAQGPTMANTNLAGTFTQSVTGVDRAGNRTTVPCTYRVVVPACHGQTPTIVGNAQNNVLNGTAGRDVIVGLGGADTINGLGGNDVICGGDGPDKLYGGDGNDWIHGGASADELNGGNGDDYLDGGLHNDSIRGDSGRDTCLSGEVRMSSCEL
jgi:hypothetical protein